ncbi:hypothetical protein, partial [Zobellia russellii]|uniref:hypothetical protein n=1 Tax=Zobellia russellii TaxID=248907 RepID=UPI00293D6762
AQEQAGNLYGTSVYPHVEQGAVPDIVFTEHPPVKRVDGNAPCARGDQYERFFGALYVGQQGGGTVVYANAHFDCPALIVDRNGLSGRHQRR